MSEQSKGLSSTVPRLFGYAKQNWHFPKERRYSYGSALKISRSKDIYFVSQIPKRLDLIDWASIKRVRNWDVTLRV